MWKALQLYRKLHQLSLLLVTLALLVSACAAQSEQTENISVDPQPTPTATPTIGRGVGDTLRILFWQAPTILNPHLATGGKDWAASRITYEPLASVDKEGNLIPFLAAEIPSLENGGLAEDGRSVTWKLKQGVRWSDGEPFTADDVRFTYEFITNPATGATTSAIYDTVEVVEVIDDYTVQVHFTEVNPAWSLPFVGLQGMIIPRHIFEEYNGSNARQAPANTLPVGTGPYRVIPPGIKPQEVLFLGNRLVETNKIVFEPNPFFREEDKPFFRQVELKGGGTELEAARAVLQAGDVDFSFLLQVDVETLAELEAEGKGQVVANKTAFVERILLNRTDPNRATADGERSSLEFPHPFFSDKKVRQAFAHAIDRQAVAELYGQLGRPTSALLVEPPIYRSDKVPYEYNLEQAKALLDEAGWRDTNGDGIRDQDGVRMKVIFQTSTNQIRQATQRIVQQALRSIGVEVEVKVLDASDFFSSDPTNPDSRQRFHADLQEFADGNRSPDPGAYLKLWTCDEIPQKANNWSGENFERWCSPEYDALYEQSLIELDPERRQQLFIQMNELLVEEVVLIPMVHRSFAHGLNKTIVGADFTPWDAELWNIKDWRRVSP